MFFFYIYVLTVSTISLQFGRKKGFLVYSTRLLDNVVQVRGFKTERNKRAEELRNPSASVKFKQWLPFFKVQLDTFYDKN